MDIFDHPAHPYTKALLESNPRESDTEKRMKSIPGSPPLLYEKFKGCAFAPRCKYADDKCRSCVPVTENVSEGHSTACFKWRGGDITMSEEKDRQPFISVRDLKKYFCLDNYKLAKAKTRYIHAVDDVSF